jgi:hypothetical protein
MLDGVHRRCSGVSVARRVRSRYRGGVVGHDFGDAFAPPAPRQERMSSTFHILLDARWRLLVRSRLVAADEVHRERSAHRGADSAKRGAASPIELGFDLVVQGRSVTEFVEREPLLPFLRSLIDAFREVAGGTRAKALVAFRSAPWELAVTAHDADHVSLAVFQIVPPGDVTLEACAISWGDAQRAVGAVLDELHTGLRSLDQALGVAPLVESLHDVASLRARLDALSEAGTPPPARSLAVAVTPIEVETRTSGGLVLRTRIDATHDDLLGYDGAIGVDRHVLRAAGTIEVASERGGGARVRLRPLVMLDGLLRSVALRLALEEPPSPRWTLVEVEGVRVDLAVVPGASALTIDRPGQAAVRIEGETVELLLGWIEHAGQVFEAAVRANAWLGTNLVVLDVHERVDELVRLVRTALAPSSAPCGSAVRPRSGPPLRAGPHPPLVARRASAAAARWEEADGMSWEPAWRREIPQGVPNGVVRGSAGVVVVRTTQRVVGLDAGTGSVAWERRFPVRVDRYGIAAANGSVLVDVAHAPLHVLDEASGEELGGLGAADAAPVVFAGAWRPGAADSPWLVVRANGVVERFDADGGRWTGTTIPRMGVRSVFVRPEGGRVLIVGARALVDVREGPSGELVPTVQRTGRAMPERVCWTTVATAEGRREVVAELGGARVWMRADMPESSARWEGATLSGVRSILGVHAGVLFGLTGAGIAMPPSIVRTVRVQAAERPLVDSCGVASAVGPPLVHVGSQLVALAPSGKLLAQVETGVAAGATSFAWQDADLSVTLGRGVRDVDTRGATIVERWALSRLLVPLR